jgi:hypothetical protein
MDHVGMPLRDGLGIISLIGVGLRDRIRIRASGKITSTFGSQDPRPQRIGATQRAVSCSRWDAFRAQSCHGHVPGKGVGIHRRCGEALVVPDKAERVLFHRNTLQALSELSGGSRAVASV